MGYTNPDGSPDTPESILTSTRAFAMALGFLLQENEGVVVELPFQEKFPNDTHGKCSVYKQNGKINVCLLNENDELHQQESGQRFMIDSLH